MTDSHADQSESLQSQGGIARAEKLSAEDRSAIARVAAEARWEKEAEHDPNRPVYPKATHVGILKIGPNVEIECAVLEDGTRVLSRAGFVRAIGRKGKVKGGADYEPESKLPVFLGADNLKPFIDNELESNSSPIYFKQVKRGVSMGYRAALLPAVCNVFLRAKDADALRDNQLHIAKQCEILVRGLAVVGITAMVDEATGYQEVRDRLALQEILEKYISGALLEWTKTFPIEFYREVFRLKGWEWNAGKMSPLVGRYTNDLVYQRLAPGVLEQLQEKNPVTEKGYRLHKHHQWLTRDIGHPALTHHIYRLLGMMEASPSWDDFKRKVDAKIPKINSTALLDLDA
jgi:hypothetical protein